MLVDNENKCWIHTVDFNLELIKSIDENKVIGFKKSQSTKNLSNKFFPGNEIFFVTRVDGEFVCYGHTIVEKISRSSKRLYDDFYDNKYELKIKRIKYFLQPVVIDDIKTQLCSINSANRISNVLKVGYYKNIAFEDYKTIKKQSSTTGLFPMYLEQYSKNMKEFILDNCRSLHNILKSQKNNSQIEINEFISMLQLSLNGFGIDKDEKYLKSFYSRYAHELKFKHLPSRDSKKFVVLLTPLGEKKNFSYISLE